ncbi:nucleotidyltransferase substrate binding protein [Thalassolituus oleivorans]|jgi:nucleotidyltransferase substrate binding protein (TIGR01987 family)|uniref:nucleotidyltransferase substrate binding protein n=1 Tax=Thalassolituus oleivorans TaxID=187493 RepID=UPI001CE33690|nr:nucleotidyltransferase substrate binding protein [Thalassolituus oleivorans]MCA6129097.1 nucleotidyltransferase [Thalassolituus oleivorans 4BN06-13]
MNLDIRWHQHLANYTSAFNELDEAVALNNQRPLSKLEEQGLIQAFEYTYELAWNSIKDFYQAQGESDIQGSRDAIRMAFRRGLITDGDLWMEMIKSRTLTSHTYNRETARLIVSQILNDYHNAFKLLLTNLQNRKQEET